MDTTLPFLETGTFATMTDTSNRSSVDPNRSGTDRAATDASDVVEKYAISTDCTHEEFLAAAKVYAREVVDRHDLSVRVGDLDWRVSTRAKRRAGATKYRDGEPTVIVLAWGQFESCGWPAVAETVRHELIHAYLLDEEDDPSHGAAFERLADELDAEVHCDRFSEPDWWVTCTDCDSRVARYRRSKLVTSPEKYRCRHCGGSFRVERNE